LQSANEELALRLGAAGIRAGDRVMIVCENCRAAVIGFFAVLEIGAWPVMVNARQSDREIDDIRQHCGARAVLYTTGISVRARTHAQRHGARSIEFGEPDELSLSPIDEAALPEPLEPDPAGNVAALVYTTGTTGRPKGVMLSHANLLFVARESSRIRSFSPRDRIYGILPVSHILGLTGVLISGLLCGAQIRLASRFDPAAAFAAIRDGLTAMIGTPTMYAMLAEYATRNGLAPASPQSLRLISSAGAPLDLATKHAAERTFRLPLHNGYGITETSPTLTLTRLQAPREDCSVGPLLPGIEARLASADGAAASSGDAGELWVRGPGVMKGYYRSAAETAQVLDEEGWFHTGDLARFEGDHLFIVGRAKEMIVRFGFNVYPAEVESVLNAHPGVAGSAVVGRTGNDGEEVIAFVQPVAGSNIRPEALSAHCAAGLSAYKRPTRIVMLDALPSSPTGKILKSTLADMARALPQ